MTHAVQDKHKLEDSRKKLLSCAKALRVPSICQSIKACNQKGRPARHGTQARMAKEQVEVWKKAKSYVTSLSLESFLLL